MIDVATIKQQKFLVNLGYPGDPSKLSKKQATAMIDQLLDPDQARVRRYLELEKLVLELEAELLEAREELSRWKPSPEVWRSMIKLVHPDHHHGGAMEEEATQVTQWLVARKPAKVEKV